MTEKPRRDVLKKSVAIIEALSQATAPMRFIDLVEAAELPKSTSHRLLGSLVGEGLVDFDDHRQRYRLGLKFLGWAAKTWRSVNVSMVAQDEMEWLGSEVGEQVSLAMLDGVEVVYVRTTERHQPLRILVSQIGDREPAHCTAVGKVMLADLTDARFRKLVGPLPLKRFTEYTITDRALLEQELSRVRDLGFALSDREKHEMVHGIAAPIFNFEGRVIAALNIWAPTFETDQESLLGWTDLLCATASRISQRMGCTASSSMSGYGEPGGQPAVP